MSHSVPNDLRDDLITSFRQELCRVNKVVPFPHQAAWWAATDGAILLDVEVDPGQGIQVRTGQDTLKWLGVAPRGSRARVVADLGSFKIGKSWSSAMWAAAFACIPNARVQLVGLEYDICSPEFEYLCQFLLSESGMNLKAESLQNRPRDGRMWMDLPNGARFEAKSWERKDTLKGKEIDCYLYCEAYMLPGLECYTSFSQNLRARNGYAVFATTPDRPWVKELHEWAHSGDPKYSDWHCTCNVSADVNPYTFDQRSKDRDKNLMTREKFAIHWEGKLGDFVGRVYSYQRGERQFSPKTHPDLFDSRGNFTLPLGWDISGACDTGTFSSAVIVAFSPDGEAFVLYEFPNYSYVSGDPEMKDQSIPEWAADLALKMAQLGGRCDFYADKNSQWKIELRNYGINLLGNVIPLETRTEVAREYFQHSRVWLAPWLEVLPFEIENAQWPDETTASGKFARLKDRDHTLDCLEHILSKRPRGKGIPNPDGPKRWIDSFLGGQAKLKGTGGDPHLGRL